MFARKTVGIILAGLLAIPMTEVAAEPNAGWQIRAEVNGKSCRAFLFGTAIDTQIVRNNENKLVLAPGHPDWETHEGPTALTLQVDDGQAVPLNGIALFRTVFIVIEDDAELQAIKGATTLKWHFPWGDYTATVTGLGASFDKLDQC